jgi:hypothetical protein
MSGTTPQKHIPHTGDAGDAVQSPPILRRRMIPAELLGGHSHMTTCGKGVHVWIRDGKYLARGRYQGRPYGVALGTDEREAVAALRRLLVELEDATFKPPSEARIQLLRSEAVPRQTIRQLCQNFLAEKRRIRGKKTAGDYRNRLVPLIEFSEDPDIRRRWPRAGDIDRDFVVRFSSFLHQRRVTRNGRPSSKEKPLSPGQVFNILDTSRTMFSWARRPEVHQLSSAFGNPFTEDLVGFRPRKDPFRPVAFPLDLRVRLVEQTDSWQLCQLALALTLPLRPEDYTGLLISEVDFERRILKFGTRFDGWDFNKGQQAFRVPFPAELEPLLRRCARGRADGPLLLQRSIVDGRRRPKVEVLCTEDVRQHFERAMAAAKPNDVQAKQDGKRLFRRLLRAMGGVSADSLAKEFGVLLTLVKALDGARFYDLRAAATTDLKDAGVDHLIQLYVTGHSLAPEILSRYVSLRLDEDMRAYFRHVHSLLDAIRQRAAELGIT